MVKNEIVGACPAGKTAMEHLKETKEVVVVEQKVFKITDIQMIPIREPIKNILPQSGREKRRERRKTERKRRGK